MSVLQLSLKEARHLHLAAQGLLKKPRRRARASDILQTVQQMSLLQIDSAFFAPSGWLITIGSASPLYRRCWRTGRRKAWWSR